MAATVLSAHRGSNFCQGHKTKNHISFFLCSKFIGIFAVGISNLPTRVVGKLCSDVFTGEKNELERCPLSLNFQHELQDTFHLSKGTLPLHHLYQRVRRAGVQELTKKAFGRRYPLTTGMYRNPPPPQHTRFGSIFYTLFKRRMVL